MGIITNFFERKEQKQQSAERSALVELTLSEIIKDVRKSFFAFTDRSLYVQKELEETSVDVAIDAYLIGVSYSKFSAFGESEQQVLKRASKEIKTQVDTLLDYWLFWGEYDDSYNELYDTCRTFVERWWLVGFQKGTKRRRLRLH